MASNSDLTRPGTTSGYEGVSIFAVVLILVLCCWSCWISHCETRALNHFDKALEVQR